MSFKRTSAAVFILSCTFASQALAEGYGPPRPRGFSGDTSRSSRYWVGVENLFGYSSQTQKVKFETAAGPAESEVDVSRISLLGGGTGNVYAVPRLSLDVLAGTHVTIGGALSYFSGTASAPAIDGFVEADASNFGLHGRLGVVLGGERVAVWPRFGWSTYSTTLEVADTTTTETGSALVIDLPLVFRGSLVGVSMGPSIYFPVSGSVETRSDDSNAEPLEGDASVGGWALNVSCFVML